MLALTILDNGSWLLRMQPTNSRLRPTVYGGTVLLADETVDAGGAADVVYFETPVGCWNYTLSFDLAITDEHKQRGAGSFAIAVDLEVECGWLGLGCMDADVAAYAGKEVMVSIGKRREVVVPIADLNTAAKLMVRNTNDTDWPSRARIYDLRLLDLSKTILPGPSDVEGASATPSRLIGFGVGHLIPNVLSTVTYEPVNGALIESSQPLTVVLPQQQWAYGLLFPLQRQPLAAAGHNGPIVVQLDVEVSTGGVGISTIDRAMDIICSEQVLGPGHGVVQIQIVESEKTYAVLLRTTTVGDVITRVSINDIGVFTPAKECLAVRRHDLKHDLYVILAPPKTGTQTIEQTLLSLSPAAEVRRLHYAAESTVASRSMSATLLTEMLRRDTEFTASARSQVSFGEFVRKEIADVRRLGGRIAFITAFRDPIDRAVAATFQSLPYYLPAFYQLYAVGPKFVDLLREGLLARWRREIDGEILRDLENCLWCRCLAEANYYCDEFEANVGCDLRSHPFNHKHGYILFEHGRDTVLALRTSDLQRTLPGALSGLTGRSDIRVVSTNICKEKNDLGELDQDFRAEFCVPHELVDAIYAQHTWLSYFYSEAEIEAARQRWLPSLALVRNRRRQ